MFRMVRSFFYCNRTGSKDRSDIRHVISREHFGDIEHILKREKRRDKRKI